MPTVSVVIPTYNRANVICRAVDSVRQQTYPGVEIIVVDDGSTDDTQAVLARYGDEIRVIHQENGGASVARNAGLLAAQGEYICLLDSDDWLLPTNLEEQVGYLETHPEKGAVLCGFRMLDAYDSSHIMDVTSLPAENLLEAILWQMDGFFPPTVVTFRKGCAEKAGLFDPSILIREEQDFWMRMALAGVAFGMNEDVLCVYMNGTDTKGKDPIRAEETIPRILNKILADERLPERIRPYKGEILARSWTEFGYTYYTRSAQAGEPISIPRVQTYMANALHNTTRIARWHDETLDQIAYLAIDVAPDCPAEGLRLILAQAGVSRRAFSVLLARVHMVLAFRAYEARQRRSLLYHFWNALIRDIGLVRNRGFLAILARAFREEHS
jgi:glycosyltransferase involved in cell wall biosynthesis